MTQYSVRNSDIVSLLIRELHDTTGLSFREIARKTEFSGMPAGTICAIYHGAPIPNKWREPLGLAPLVKVPADMVRKTKPVADDPRNLTRTTIYPGTPPAKISADLRRVTGQRWVLDERTE